LLASLQTLQAQQPRFTEFRTDREIENDEWHCKITETADLTNYIIQLVTSKTESDYWAQWVCVQIFEKTTGNFVQEIDLSEDYWHNASWDMISVDDYNFDGYEDFSLFGGYGTLDNSYSYYFLFDPETQTFFESEIGGANLEFDSYSKTITSRNRCCAGTKAMYQTYKLVDNRMILLEQKCLTTVMMFDEENDEIYHLMDDEGWLIFEEEDCEKPYLDMQLESVGLDNNFQLRLAIYDEDKAGGFVQYKGQTERIPIHLDFINGMDVDMEGNEYTDDNRADSYHYNEMYKGEINGVYYFVLYRNSIIDNVYYVRAKDGKTFTLKIVAQ
jgi:hypothetical protein